MKRQYLTIVIILLMVLCVTVYWAFHTLDHNKTNLIKEDVLAIFMCKPEPFCKKKRSLTSRQIENFIQKWNSSSSIGYNRIYCSYYVEVYLKNGKKRSFGIVQDEITEHWGGGEIYSISDKNYFDILYTTLEHSP